MLINGEVGEWGSVERLKFPGLSPGFERFFSTISRLNVDFVVRL